MKKMYDLFRLPTYQHLCALGGFFACLLFGFQVNAQTVAAPDSAFQRFMWTTTGANSQSVGVGSNGTLVASPTGSGTLAGDGAKTLKYDRPATWRNGSNNPVTGAVSGRIPINTKAAKLLTAGMKLAPFLGTGVALWEMAQELGFNPSKDANGDVSVTRSTGAITGGYRVGLLPYVSTFQAACNAYRDTLLASNPGWTASVIVNVTTCQVALQLNGGSASNFTQPIQFLQSVPPSTAPATLLDLENAIAEKSGWPSTSKLPTALRDAATATGETIDVETPRITGPATSPGTTSTTTNPTNNTTTTNTVTHNHTYNDNRVTNTITRASTVTNNTTGAGTTTTTTEQPVEELSDCEKNPGSIACAELDTPDDEIPKTEKQVSFTPENLGFGGGSCPANVVMTPANMATPITVINWADNCQKITTYAKPMILAMALFAAMMIIFVGKTE